MHTGNGKYLDGKGEHEDDRFAQPAQVERPSTTDRSLLDREIPIDYLQEWTQAIAQEADEETGSAALSQDSLKIGQAKATQSIMIFRLGSERFALPVCVLQEITRPVPIHTLPHRSNGLLLGLVNMRGEILPCASLSQFLGVEMPIDPTYSRINLRRMMVVERPAEGSSANRPAEGGSAKQSGSRWVFPVDEVHRVYRFHFGELQPPPVVIAKATRAYTQGIIDWRSEKVNYLDADRLLDALDRRLL